MSRKYICLAVAALALFALVDAAQAGTTWDGGGVADANWTTNTNWNSDTLPAFDGTDAITLSALNASGTATLLNGDKNISSLTTAPNLSYSISGDTLTLQSGNITSVSTANNIIINSNVALGANATFNFNTSTGVSTINGIISDGASSFTMNKSGTRTLIFTGNNSYDGNTTVSGGILRINGATSTTGNFSVNSGATLGVGNNGALGSSSAVLTLNSGSIFAATTTPITIPNPISLSGSVQIGDGAVDSFFSLNGNLTLTGNTTINPHSGSTSFGVIVNGSIEESGGSRNLSIGPNNRRIRFNNVFNHTGTTSFGTAGSGSNTLVIQLMADNATRNIQATLRSADLQFGHANALGSGTTLTISNTVSTQSHLSNISGSPMTLTNPMIWQSGFDMSPNSQAFTLSGSASLQTNASVSFNGSTGLITMGNDVTESGGSRSLQFTVPNQTVRLSGNSSYSGGFIWQSLASSNNTLQVASDTAFGTGTVSILNPTAGRTTTLQAIGGARTYTNNLSLTVVDTFIVDGSHTFNGSGTLNNNHIIQVNSGGTLAILGGLGENSAGRTLTKTSSGTLIIGPGSYTTLNNVATGGGTVIAAGNNALGTNLANTTFASGTTLGFQGNINYSAAKAVTVSGTGVGALGAIQNVSGNNTFGGTITLAANTTIGSIAGSLALSNVITDGASSFNLIKSGTGSLALNSLTGNTYDGTTTVGAGTLLVNNTSGSATGTGLVSISSGATLGGNGFIGNNVTAGAGGIISPGNSAGTLTVNGNVAFTNSTSQFAVELSEFASDQLVVNGTVSLGSATLAPTILADIPVNSKLFLVVNNDVDAITGTFNGLANGASVSLGAYTYGAASAKISYFGDFATNSLTGGNDIVLYDFFNTSPIPEPATSSSLLLALGLVGRRFRRAKRAE